MRVPYEIGHFEMAHDPLGVGQQPQLGDRKASDRPSVRGVDVVEDSRCPIDVTCVWAGEITLRLSVKVRSKDASERELKAGESAVIEDREIKLERVEPAPRSTAKIDRADYRATLRVSPSPSVTP